MKMTSLTTKQDELPIHEVNRICAGVKRKGREVLASEVMKREVVHGHNAQLKLRVVNLGTPKIVCQNESFWVGIRKRNTPRQQIGRAHV